MAADASLAEFPAGAFDGPGVAGGDDPAAGGVPAEADFGDPGFAPGRALAGAGEVDPAAGTVVAEAADVPPRPST